MDLRKQGLLISLVTHLKHAQMRNRRMLEVLTGPQQTLLDLKEELNLAELKIQKLTNENSMLEKTLEDQTGELMQLTSEILGFRSVLDKKKALENDNSELKNYVDNLKWGFETRETELVSQVKQYKHVAVSLFKSQQLTGSSLREYVEEMCDTMAYLDGIEVAPVPSTSSPLPPPQPQPQLSADSMTTSDVGANTSSDHDDEGLRDGSGQQSSSSKVSSGGIELVELYQTPSNSERERGRDDGDPNYFHTDDKLGEVADGYSMPRSADVSLEEISRADYLEAANAELRSRVGELEAELRSSIRNENLLLEGIQQLEEDRLAAERSEAETKRRYDMMMHEYYAMEHELSALREKDHR